MKKWFIKHRDNILTNSIAGIVVFAFVGVCGFCADIFLNLYNLYQGNIYNFINKFYEISIPFYIVILFILSAFLTSKFYSGIKNRSKKLKIISAPYFTDEQSIDIADELNDAIEDSKLKIVLSNYIAGDPHKGVIKKAKIKYEFNGQVYQKEYQEGELIKLPEVG